MNKLVFVFIISMLISCKPDDGNEEKRSDNAVKITDSAPKSSQNPCFSPDGQEIVFTRFLKGYNAGASEIVKMKTDGSGEQILVSAVNSGNVTVPYGSWVGHEICFTSDRAGKADEVWIVNDDGSNLRQITTHPEDSAIYYIEAGFNPKNTKQIVFEHVRGENDKTAIHQIAFLDVVTGKITRLTSGVFDDRLPSWSNDGTKILFQRNNYGQDEGWRVYTADIDIATTAQLSNIQLVYHGESEYTDCSWSFDDRAIVSSSPFNNINVPNIWTFPVDVADNPTQKTFSDFHEDGAPSQSHDGKTIAFESHFGEDEEEPSEIWIVK